MGLQFGVVIAGHDCFDDTDMQLLQAINKGIYNLYQREKRWRSRREAYYSPSFASSAPPTFFVFLCFSFDVTPYLTDAFQPRIQVACRVLLLSWKAACFACFCLRHRVIINPGSQSMRGWKIFQIDTELRLNRNRQYIICRVRGLLCLRIANTGEFPGSSVSGLLSVIDSVIHPHRV